MFGISTSGGLFILGFITVFTRLIPLIDVSAPQLFCWLPNYPLVAFYVTVIIKFSTSDNTILAF